MLFRSRTLTPSRVDADRGLAYFILPLDVVSGDVRLYSADPAQQASDVFPLQIVPVITDAQVEWVSWDGQTMSVILSGYGFRENHGSQYVVGGETIEDTGDNVDVFDSGWWYDSEPNTRVRLTLPLISPEARRATH